MCSILHSGTCVMSLVRPMLTPETQLSADVSCTDPRASCSGSRLAICRRYRHSHDSVYLYWLQTRPSVDLALINSPYPSDIPHTAFQERDVPDNRPCTHEHARCTTRGLSRRDDVECARAFKVFKGMSGGRQGAGELVQRMDHVFQVRLFPRFPILAIALNSPS